MRRCLLVLVCGLACWLAPAVAAADPGDLLRIFENPNPGPHDHFGDSMAVLGDKVLIAAPYAPDANGEGQAGAAYLFDGNTGELLRTFYPEPGYALFSPVATLGNNFLIPGNGDAVSLYDGSTGELLHVFCDPVDTFPDSFGSSLAALGGNVLIGDRLESEPGYLSGAVYLFDGSSGELLRTFSNPGPDHHNLFGHSIAAVGPNVLVGAYDSDPTELRGAAYLLDGSTGEVLLALNDDEEEWLYDGSNFGQAVAAYGDDLIVAGDSHSDSQRAGVFLFDGTTAEILTRFMSPDFDQTDAFGWSLAVVGDDVLVGAAGFGDEAAYLFDATTANVLLTLPHDPAAGIYYGAACVAAFDTDILISGSLSGNGGEDVRAVFLVQGIPEPSTFTLLIVALVAAFVVLWGSRVLEAIRFARARAKPGMARSPFFRPLRLGMQLLEDRRYLTANPFSIVMLPDTQMYSRDLPVEERVFEVFTDQTQWVADQINEQEEEIVFVTHVGDVVNDNQTYQWENADTAMGILDSEVPSLVYGVLAGNHDYDYTYMHTYFSEFVDYFGPERYEDWVTRAWDEYGYSDSPEIYGLNHFQVFTGGGQQYLNISLEWQPRQESINWAQQVMNDHPDLPVILSTHEYLTLSGTHSTTSPRDGVARNYHNGEGIFTDLVYPNPQVFMVLSGHFHGWARLTSEDVADQAVYEMVADYQDWLPPDEEYGYLRILEFDAGNDEIHVTTYSPTLDEYLTDGGNQFTLSMDFDERFGFPPTARLYAPVDNDAEDQDHLTNTVTVDTPQSQFQIQLYAHSDAIDDGSVDADEDGMVDAGLVSISRGGGAMPACTFTYDAELDRITVARADGQPFEFDEYTITFSTDITDVGDRPLPEGTELTVVIESSSVLVAKCSEWRYLDEGSNQGPALLDPGTGWGEATFDDSQWASGVGQLGYGDNDEGTRVSYIDTDPNTPGVQKNATTYFRHTLEVANTAAIESLTLNLLRDDGAVVYLNGQQVVRSNMPETFDWQTWAQAVVDGDNEDAYYGWSVDPAYLVSGLNIVAVEVHQQNAGSSDISFDLELRARQIIASFDEGSGMLSVFGTTENDSISIASESGYVTLNGQELSGPVDAEDVEEIRVYGYAGDDVIDLSGVEVEDFTALAASGAIRIEGGAGDDELVGSGDFGETFVFSGSGLGADSINPAAGVSYLQVGDTILVAPDSVATIDGDLVFAESGQYSLEVAWVEGGDHLVPDLGQIQVTGDANLNGTLSVQGADRSPNAVDWWAYGSTNVITALSLNDTTFGTAPDMDEHLGRGAFCTGVTYSESAVTMNVLQALSGDTDGDGDVDISDFNRLINNYTGPSGSGKDWTLGDFDGDGDVDINDFNDVINHYTGPQPLGYWSQGEGGGAGGGGGGEEALMAELLARGYTPPAWLFEHWASRLDSLQPDWLYQFEQDGQSADRDNPSQEFTDHVMELLLAYSA